MVANDPTNSQAKLKLAECLEIAGNKREALQLMEQGTHRSMQGSAPLIFIVHKAPSPTVMSEEIIEEDLRSTFLLKEQDVPSATKKRQQRELTKLESAEREAEYTRSTLSTFQALESQALDLTEVSSRLRWLSVVAPLIDGFRQNPALFPADKVNLPTSVGND